MNKLRIQGGIIFLLGLILAICSASIFGVEAGTNLPSRVVNATVSHSAPGSLPGFQFVHTATSENNAANWTSIDLPQLNDNPNAIFFVSQNWNPNGIGGQYNDHSIGVWYSSSSKRWNIFNQDKTDMDAGAAFNVLIPDGDYSVFVHAASPSNIVNNWTNIDHPLTNNNPDAVILITQNWNPGGIGNVYNDHPVGVWYSDISGKWGIFNQDKAAMPDGASFNVIIPPSGPTAFVHTALPTTLNINWTELDHPYTNNNLSALVFATQNWNPSGGSGIYNDHNIGVWYNFNTRRWAVFNQDQADMPDGASFNLIVSERKIFIPLLLK